MPPKPPESCPVPGATGFVRPDGPRSAKILLVGERPGAQEAVKSRPFIGPSGDQLDRILRFIKRERCDFRVANCFECRSPGDWTVGAPWEESFCVSCNDSLEAELSNPNIKVVVPLGGTPLRKIMKLPKNRGKEAAKVQDFHGAPVRDPSDRFWVVPTFHPAHLLRGQQKLTKTVCFDLQTACDLADGKWEFDQPELVIDPPIDWFQQWVSQYLASADQVWLAVDIETPDKGKKTDEGELGGEDASFEILRINLSYHPDQGITVPWAEPYISEVRKMLAASGTLIFHNGAYDIPRLKKQGVEMPGAIYDTMDSWHLLQPTLPRGLGFVAPFYSRTGPWKHLGNQNLTYCALDGVQTLRIAYGVARDLQARGQWEVYIRDCFKRDTYSLRPAEEVGILVNRERLVNEFIPEVTAAIAEAEKVIDAIVPEEVKPLDGPYVKRPGEGEVVEKAEGEIRICRGCGQERVVKSHKCKGWCCRGCGSVFPKKPKKKDPACCGSAVYERLSPKLEMSPVGSVRYYKKLPFNPDSWQQVLAYIKFRKHKPGTAKKTKKETTDKKTLQRLLKTGDPFYAALLKNRQAAKMKGTYGDGILEKLDAQNRIHGHFGHLPWTMRLNSTNPNLQNLADHVEYAPQFKRCIEAGPGCKLIEIDFSGIEALMVGYFSGDPNYIRLAKLSVHGYLQSHLLFREKKISEPISLKWSDADIRAAVKDLKDRFLPVYDKAKRCVHGYSYGLTEFGMSDYYPEVFPTRTSAREVIVTLEEICPKLKPWQGRICKAAHEKQFLGGPSPERGESATARYHEMILGMYHPYGYRCEFYGVVNYRKGAKGEWIESRGEDAKKAISYYPQSGAAGRLCEAELELFIPESKDFIGDAYYGMTPLRAPIHDSLFLEVPTSKVDEVLEKTSRVMQRMSKYFPMPSEWGLGDYLTIGVEAEVGRNWAPVDGKRKWAKDGNPEGMTKVGVESFAEGFYDEEEDEETA